MKKTFNLVLVIRNWIQKTYPNKRFNHALNSKYLSQCTNIPESDYARIHAQVVKIFETFSSDIRESHVLRMINDIRFGSDFILLSFKKLTVNDFQVKNFRIIVEMFQVDYKDSCKNFSALVRFLLQLYAIIRIKYKKGSVKMELVASDNLLELGIPVKFIELLKLNFPKELCDK